MCTTHLLTTTFLFQEDKTKTGPAIKTERESSPVVSEKAGTSTTKKSVPEKESSAGVSEKAGASTAKKSVPKKESSTGVISEKADASKSGRLSSASTTKKSSTSSAVSPPSASATKTTAKVSASVIPTTQETYFFSWKQPVLLELKSLKSYTQSIAYKMEDPDYNAEGLANILQWNGQSFAFVTVNAKDSSVFKSKTAVTAPVFKCLSKSLDWHYTEQRMPIMMNSKYRPRDGNLCVVVIVKSCVNKQAGSCLAAQQ